MLWTASVDLFSSCTSIHIILWMDDWLFHRLNDYFTSWMTIPPAGRPFCSWIQDGCFFCHLNGILPRINYKNPRDLKKAQNLLFWITLSKLIWRQWNFSTGTLLWPKIDCHQKKIIKKHFFVVYQPFLYHKLCR